MSKKIKENEPSKCKADKRMLSEKVRFSQICKSGLNKSICHTWIVAKVGYPNLTRIQNLPTEMAQQNFPHE